MAAQSVLIAETIAGMKKAIRRRDSSSDSDASIHQPTNRGNKLKRKARYVHEGHLDVPNAPRVYKRKIEHAGYQRYILSHNPRRFDDCGDELEDDDVDAEADAAAAEENLYGGIKLENLLAPLTSAAELPSHPSLSIPYVSQTLSEMTQQACGMVRREKASLWKMKQLLTMFRGDEIWAPCGHLQTENDITLFGPMRTGNTEEFASVHEEGFNGHLPTEQTQLEMHAINDRNVIFPGSIHGQRTTNAMLEHGADVKDLEIGATQGNILASNGNIAKVNVHKDDTVGWNSSYDKTVHADGNGHRKDHEAAESDDAASNLPKQNPDATLTVVEAGRELRSNCDEITVAPVPIDTEIDAQNLLSAPVPDNPSGDGDEARGNSPRAAGPEGDDGKQAEEGDREEDGDNSQPAQHRMTTRAQAQAASDNTTSARTRSPSLASSTSTFVHPLFLVPPSAHPDRDFGLPPGEAEDTRRVLMSYVQKQEEVCRGVEKLYEGLLRADRMRKTVLRWCKAEAHVGEMSDGEDWYDKEEWALDEDLKKGHEEEEDEGGNQGKKTRGRRA
ncbi:MAG: hypothetical protein M1830_008905 [Pleopsidium flavum]|nr:MAG: hypothetical protein M1830_008905 [Pleopsidium flavum]